MVYLARSNLCGVSLVRSGISIRFADTNIIVIFYLTCHLDHFGVQALAHLCTSVRKQNGAVPVHVDEGASLQTKMLLDSLRVQQELRQNCFNQFRYDIARSA